MNPISEALIEHALALDCRETVTDIRIGLGYTAVKLESGKCGVACTLRHRLQQATCSLLPEAGSFAGRDVSQLVPLLRSEQVVEAALGLAAINALAADFIDEQKNLAEMPISDLLRITPQDRVGMIGSIVPVVQEIKPRAQEVIVFDEGKDGQKGITETAEEGRILPECDVIILSSTSLLNHTCDELLTMSADAREVCLMGPSTPLFADVFRERGVTALAGRQVTKADKLLQIISEAGGTRRFGKVTNKVNWRLAGENN